MSQFCRARKEIGSREYRFHRPFPKRLAQTYPRYRGDAADHHEQSDGLVRQQFLSEHQQAECRAAGSTYAAIWLVSDAD